MHATEEYFASVTAAIAKQSILSNMVTMNEVPTGAEEKNRYRDVLPSRSSYSRLYGFIHPCNV